mmetsp:Transcript_8504/g.13064  ORF Transcript_8504/g.13064 Transcript_8504/m.13064 type:complete len:99 (-) Transcript_8504:1259-1555(-)
MKSQSNASSKPDDQMKLLLRLKLDSTRPMLNQSSDYGETNNAGGNETKKTGHFNYDIINKMDPDLPKHTKGFQVPKTKQHKKPTAFIRASELSRKHRL